MLRGVADDLYPQEEFLGLYNIPTIEAATLTSIIKDSPLWFNHEDSPTMSGLYSGVAKRILEEEPRAVFTHCYGRALNLAASDTVKNCKALKSALETTHEIVKLVNFSP